LCVFFRAPAHNDKTQEVIDANIGDANYDIGHNFNTEDGGNAGCIGCVCTTGSKGSGMTGVPNPTGDSFDIDYVAHEIIIKWEDIIHTTEQVIVEKWE
jgi:hypothetical protein